MVIPTGAMFLGLWPIIGQSRAFTSAASTYVFYVLISQKWERRHELWFWLSISVFALLHVIALTIISFPYQIRPALISLPFAVADGLAMWVVLGWLEKRIAG